MDSDDLNLEWQVVINDEEQYSIYPKQRELPNGWNTVGKEGTREECLAYIEEVWVDMRPLSLRNEMSSES